MGSLKSKSISQTYQRILQTPSEVSDTTLKSVETGSGKSTSMKLSTDKVEFLKVGVGTGGVSPDGLIHAYSTSAGSVTASSFANELVLENSGDSGLSILSGATASGNIYFGDAGDNDAGRISYNHSSDNLIFSTSGSDSMTLDSSGNLNITGILSQSEDRYMLDEYFHKLPYKDIQDCEVTQSSSATTAVASNTKNTRITTVANDLAANDSQEFTFTNLMIHDKSHVDAMLVDTSATVADNASVVVMAYGIANGSCKIRIANTGVDIASMTFTIQVIVDPHIDANDHWVLDGTNSNETKVTYAGTQPGLRIYTDSGDNDQSIVHPKIQNQGNNTDLINISPWRNVNFFSEYQTELNVAISTHSTITNQAIWAGMKLTTTGVYGTDTDQAYFLYATDDDLGDLTTNGNLHFIYRIGGVDYVTDLGVTVAASSVYRLKLAFDATRRISVFVNGTQYGLTSTPTTTTAGGVTQSNTKAKSLITTAGTTLIPVVATQNLSAASRFLYCHFVKISRTLE